ncbi:biotin/lipoyl-containing protein, partial [Francisella orientalis]
MSIEIVKVPDIGDYDSVDVIEVNVAEGDVIAEEDSLITLETDKASMEVPSPVAGKVVEIITKVGDKVSQGSLILKVETGASASVATQAPAQQVAPAQSATEEVVDVKVPDIGDYDSVDVIEVSVAVGDTIAEEDSLITLETDKASMEVPSPVAGEVVEIITKVGDKVSQGS